MGDDLNIQQGGSAVATDELLTAVEGFRLGAEHLRSAQHILSSAHRIGIDGFCDTGAFPELTSALRNILQAMFHLKRITDEAEEIGVGLMAASNAYAQCEEVVGGVMHLRTQIQMGVLGFVVGRLLPWWAWLIPASEASDEVQENARLDGKGDIEFLPLFLSLLFAQPSIIDATADRVDGGNEFLFGLMGLPFLGFHIDGRGSGLANGATAAAILGIAAGGKLGVLEEGPVSTQKVESQTSNAVPSGVAETFKELPSPTPEDQVQVKIEAIHFADGTTSYEVYIAGTQSFDFVSRGEPNDMTSNFWSIAGGESGAYRAVVDAMKQAGITSSSEVNFFGHSQGGLLAAQLAASGDYNAKNVMSWGAPSGNIDLPPSVNSIVIKHDEDPVPALGGNPIDDDALIVSRSIYDSPRDVPTDRLAPAHHAEPYLETSQLVDQGTSPALQEALKILADSRRGATSVTSTTYLATRTDAG